MIRYLGRVLPRTGRDPAAAATLLEDLDRYIRVRARHTQAYRPQLWLEVSTGGR